MLTDSHCHLASHKFDADEIPQLIEKARDQGISRLVTLATCLDDMSPNLDLAEQHQGVHTCLGIHPCDAHEAPTDVIAQLRPKLADHRVCGIGETGLDYFHPAPDSWDESSYKARQQELLEDHFRLGAESRLNVVIHTRDRKGSASFEDALAIYERYAKDVRAVFHCFVGPLENARRVIDLGGLVSFGGVATFKNAAEVLAVASELPEGSFMVETDSPYLAPHPHRGQRNEPSLVRVVAEKIAEAREETLEDLASHTTESANKFFRFS